MGLFSVTYSVEQVLILIMQLSVYRNLAVANIIRLYHQKYFDCSYS